MIFDDQGNFQYMLKSDGKSPRYELSDDEKKINRTLC